MDVKKLKWCCRQSSGIKIEEPNDNLAKEYLENAEETLLVLQTIKKESNMWLATTKYYCEYFSVYAMLQKIGIKCEIHDCTIELAKFLEEMGIIPKGYSKILEGDKALRIANQYYLKNIPIRINSRELTEFILNMKNKVNSITLDEINKARGEIRRIIS
ncbi:MAG: hypothetical protein KKA64_04715 [Nanoarchaeota archaeon]|nr:hypothetical protein [Nanoarchaeota archaeon]